MNIGENDGACDTSSDVPQLKRGELGIAGGLTATGDDDWGVDGGVTTIDGLFLKRRDERWMSVVTVVIVD